MADQEAAIGLWCQLSIDNREGVASAGILESWSSTAVAIMGSRGMHPPCLNDSGTITDFDSGEGAWRSNPR